MFGQDSKEEYKAGKSEQVEVNVQIPVFLQEEV